MSNLFLPLTRAKERGSFAGSAAEPISEDVLEQTPEEEISPLSKTRLKQLAKEVEQLAEQLAALPENQFAQLPLDGLLLEEARLARNTKGRSSQRRQIKHLAAALRKREDELRDVQQRLQSLDQVARSDKRAFHQLEDLRDRLCDNATFDQAFNDMLQAFPRIDRNSIARLARSVQQHNDRRASREIFRRLRDEQDSGDE